MNVFQACNTFTGNKTAFMGIPHDIHEVYYFLPTNMPQFPNCLLYFFTFLLHTVLCLQISLCPRSFTAPSDALAVQRGLSTRFNVHFYSYFLEIFPSEYISWVLITMRLLTLGLLRLLSILYALARWNLIFPRFFFSSEGFLHILSFQ